MKKFLLIVLAVVFLPPLVIGLVSGPAGYWPIFLSVAIFTTGAIILHGLRGIPSSPPHVGLVTRFGKMLPKIKQHGWHFFFGYPWLYGFQLINVEDKDQVIPPVKVTTPDLSDSSIPADIGWCPNWKDPEDLITYIFVGGEKGVRDKFENIVVERLREWATSDGEGPQTWRELRSANEEAATILLKAILGDGLKKIPSAVPTWILHKYFSQPQIPPTEKERKRWGKNWKRVKEQLAAENEQEVREAIASRERDVAAVRQHKGTFRLPQLGIILKRLNVGEIKTLGKVAEVAEKIEVENLQRKAETIELHHIRERVLELMKPISEGGLGYTKQEARETLYVERGKAQLNINESKLSVDPALLATIENVVEEVAGAIARKAAQ